MSDADDSGSRDPAGGDRRIRAVRSDAARPAPASHPHFSQPVRQIVLMLIALALVGAGGWYAYGRIMSIFLTNPILNGVIFGVFVLGVLTCFWQVAQLITSVSWIEGFARRRRRAIEGGASAPALDEEGAPRLLAPLAALLGTLGPAGGTISTASSQSIQDSVAARIDEQRDITRYMTNLLIFLGLLGTFYGLAITVPAVVETIRALSPQEGESGLQVFDRLMEGLEDQLGGMGTAFSSSLLGLAGSLVVGLLELFVTHGQNRFYRELEEWMSGFTRVDIGGAGAVATGGDSSALQGFLDQFEARLADQVAGLRDDRHQRDEAQARQVQASQEQVRQVAAGIEGLGERILAANQSLTQALARMAEGQDRLVALAQQAAVDQPASAQEESDMVEARMHLRSLDYQLSRLIEEMASGRADMIADLREDMAALTRAIRRLERGDEV